MKNLCILFVLVLSSSCSLYNHKTHSEYSFKAIDMGVERESTSILDFQTIDGGLNPSESQENENQPDQTSRNELTAVSTMNLTLNRKAAGKRKFVSKHKIVDSENTPHSISENSMNSKESKKRKGKKDKGLVALLIVLGILLLALVIGIIWFFVQVFNSGGFFSFG